MKGDRDKEKERVVLPGYLPIQTIDPWQTFYSKGREKWRDLEANILW